MEVATVQGGGPLEGEVRATGVPVWLGARHGARGVGAVLRGLTAAVRRADVVHTHLYAGDVFGRLAVVAARTRPVVVATEHNVNPDEGWRRWPKRWTTPVADVVVAVSEAVAENLLRVERVARPEQVRVIPNGVDLDRFRAAPLPRGDGGPLRVLAVGRRVRQKGFDVLVDALPPGVRLRVAGAGPEGRAHPQVEWLGHVADVAPLYAEADVVVVPSRWEGFGLVAAEAMASGCVVVASDVGGLPEVVGDAGVLVPPGDVATLRTSLEQLAGDPGLRTRLATAGRARALSRFDVGRCVTAYEALYLELLAR